MRLVVYDDDGIKQVDAEFETFFGVTVEKHRSAQIVQSRSLLYGAGDPRTIFLLAGKALREEAGVISKKLGKYEQSGKEKLISLALRGLFGQDEVKQIPKEEADAYRERSMVISLKDLLENGTEGKKRQKVEPEED